VELLPKVEPCWTAHGQRLKVPTLGYTRRLNCFITLCWAQQRIVWDCFKRRRNIEFRRHLSHLVAYGQRKGLRKIILFVDHASAHKTPQVRKFLKEHPMLRIKFLPKKDPNSNPTETLVNRRLSAAVSVNRCHDDYSALKGSTRSFLRKYNSTYAT
jgi:hypothetical protein